MTRRALTPVLLLLVFGLLSACGGDSGDDDSAAIDTPTSSERTASSSSSSTTSPALSTTTTNADDGARIIVVNIVGGEPDGGVRREPVTLGEAVVLRVTSDVADEVHVHTYDVRADVVPGAPAELRFEASIPGVFEVELEELGREILKIEVRPA